MSPQFEHAYLKPEDLAKRHGEIFAAHRNADGVFKMGGMNLKPVAGLEKNGKADPNAPILFQQVSMAKGRYAKYGISDLALDLMKASLPSREDLKKSSLSVSSGLTWYDLRVPALHQIPWLTPIRDKMPRKQMPNGGNAAYWKTITASTLLAGGFLGTPWINEGQRAPPFSFSAPQTTVPFVSMGHDGSVTYEAEEASQSIEDANALAHFFCLEQLMVKEEDAIIGGNYNVALGTASTPTGTAGSNVYVAVVGLTYEGYRNQASNAIATGLVQTMEVTTADNKTMWVNGGCGIASAISAQLNSANQVSWTPKEGEFAWAVYTGTVGTSAGLTLQGFVTVPLIAASNVFLTTPTSTGQKLNALASTDYSYNNGTQGGQTGQVTGYNGLLMQNAIAANLATPNAYYKNLLGAVLTSSGKGSVVEIDTLLLNLWNNYKVTVDYLYVNAQELMNITSKVLNGSSAPLLRYETMNDGDHYELVASGTVAFYFNPFIPGGGRKIPVIVHPTLPPGTILAYAESLPPYFKQNNTPTVAEVLCRRDYYAIDWAPFTREWQFGVYSSNCLAVYAPFCVAVLSGIGNG